MEQTKNVYEKCFAMWPQAVKYYVILIFPMFCPKCQIVWPNDQTFVKTFEIFLSSKMFYRLTRAHDTARQTFSSARQKLFKIFVKKMAKQISWRDQTLKHCLICKLNVWQTMIDRLARAQDYYCKKMFASYPRATTVGTNDLLDNYCSIRFHNSSTTEIDIFDRSCDYNHLRNEK